jgi:hypothetical protein
MTDRLELTASTRHASESQIVERSLKFSLNPVTEFVAADGLAIKVERTRKALGRLKWDVAAMDQDGLDEMVLGRNSLLRRVEIASPSDTLWATPSSGR